MKVIISTGQGSLHLMQTAVSVKKKGVAIRIITGWIPGRFFTDARINWLAKLGGIRHNLARGLEKRRPSALSVEDLKSCGFSEFFIQGLFRMSKYKFFSYSQSAVWGWKVFGKQSKRYIRDADIFHVRSGAGAGGAIACAKKKGMKVVVDHSIAHPKEMQKQLAKANKKNNVTFDKYRKTSPDDMFWKLVLEDCLQADMLLVNSDYVKSSFIAEGFPAERIRVSHLGVNAEFNDRKTDYIIKQTIRLVFTGGFVARKGAGLIMEALEILKAKDVHFSFSIIGSITGEVLIPDWMKESPLIKMHGHIAQEEMLPILISSDIYIFPSYTEGCAQSVKEAMAVGLPVITTRQSGAPIDHGDDGWIIEDDNSSALAEAIEVLARNYELRRKIGNGAYQKIQADHTWDKYATRVVSVYQELVKKNFG